MRSKMQETIINLYSNEAHGILNENYFESITTTFTLEHELTAKVFAVVSE